MYSQIKEIKNAVNQNTYKFKKKKLIKKHYLCFLMLQYKRSWYKRMFPFFYNQISFPFSFSCTCVMGMFKKTEGFHRSIFSCQNSKFQSCNYRSSHPELFPKQGKFCKIHRKTHVSEPF